MHIVKFALGAAAAISLSAGLSTSTEAGVMDFQSAFTATMTGGHQRVFHDNGVDLDIGGAIQGGPDFQGWVLGLQSSVLVSGNPQGNNYVFNWVGQSELGFSFGEQVVIDSIDMSWVQQLDNILDTPDPMEVAFLNQSGQEIAREEIALGDGWQTYHFEQPGVWRIVFDTNPSTTAYAPTWDILTAWVGVDNVVFEADAGPPITPEPGIVPTGALAALFALSGLCLLRGARRG